MIVRNHSPSMPFIRTVLVALSYRCSMTRTRLTPMLYFLMVAHKAACHTLSNAILKTYKDMVEIFLVLQVLFAEESKVENLLCSTVSCSKAGLFFSDDLCLWLESVKDDL